MSEDIYARYRTAKPVTGRSARIADGHHTLALIDHELRDTENDGKILAADFEVVESTSMQVGTVVGCAWFVTKQPNWLAEKELGRHMVFVNQLQGNDPSDTVAAEKGARSLSHPSQPGRGLLIRCFGNEGKPGKTEKENAAKEGRPPVGFVELTWSHVPGQTPEARNARRADMEKRGVATTISANPAPVPVPVPVAAAPTLQPLPPGWPVGVPAPPGFYAPPPVPVAAPALIPLPPGWPPGAPVPPGYAAPAVAAPPPGWPAGVPWPYPGT